MIQSDFPFCLDFLLCGIDDIDHLVKHLPFIHPERSAAIGDRLGCRYGLHFILAKYPLDGHIGNQKDYGGIIQYADQTQNRYRISGL